MALHALGALDPTSADALRAHVEAGCVACRSDAEGFGAVARDLAFDAVPERPDPGLRARVLGRARADVVQREPASASSRTWREVRSGIWRHVVEASPRGRSYLIRMAPGAASGPHVHRVREECWVLSGDVRVEAQLLRAGESCRTEAGAVHEGSASAGGCLLLIVEEAAAG